MAKNYRRQTDVQRTKLLGLDGIIVQKGIGDDSYFHVYSEYDLMDYCPVCEGVNLKVQNLFYKTYKDVIIVDGNIHPVTLDYSFKKYRCLNPSCRHIFAKEISFASPQDNVTYRLQDFVAEKIIQKKSFAEISSVLRHLISRQAVGQIFSRWVHHRYEYLRKFSCPGLLAILSGQIDEEHPYTLFLSLDRSIHIIDILSGVNAADIQATIRAIGPDSVKMVITDCNPVINDVVFDAFPEAEHIIPIDFWFRLVQADFLEYARPFLRWSPVTKKEELLLLQESFETKQVDLNRLLQSREMLKQPYSDYHELQKLIRDRETPWTFKAVKDRTSSFCGDLQGALTVTLLQLDTYKDAICNGERFRDSLPDNLFSAVTRLEQLLLEKKIFSPEHLKACVLFSVPEESITPDGVPLQDVLVKIQTEDTLNEH